MNFWEIKKLLEEGKKVRMKTWKGDMYIVKTTDDKFVTSDGDDYVFIIDYHTFMLNNNLDDWEIYDERKDV